MKTTILAACTIILALATSSKADCVVGAKNKTTYTRIDNHTLLLQGGFGSDIIIKTFAFINQGSTIVVLKDDFCSYESAVLLIDGEVVDVQRVTKVD